MVLHQLNIWLSINTSPRSLPSVPSKSITRVQGSMPAHLAIQIPLVVWDLKQNMQSVKLPKFQFYLEQEFRISTNMEAVKEHTFL